jgi:hypothetical protein
MDFVSAGLSDERAHTARCETRLRAHLELLRPGGLRLGDAVLKWYDLAPTNARSLCDSGSCSTKSERRLEGGSSLHRRLASSSCTAAERASTSARVDVAERQRALGDGLGEGRRQRCPLTWPLGEPSTDVLRLGAGSRLPFWKRPGVSSSELRVTSRETDISQGLLWRVWRTSWSRRLTRVHSFPESSEWLRLGAARRSRHHALVDGRGPRRRARFWRRSRLPPRRVSPCSARTRLARPGRVSLEGCSFVVSACGAAGSTRIATKGG